MPATMPDPKFDAPALVDLAASFARRGKAIRYHGELSISRSGSGRRHGAAEHRLRIDLVDWHPAALHAMGQWRMVVRCIPIAGRAERWLAVQARVAR